MNDDGQLVESSNSVFSLLMIFHGTSFVKTLNPHVTPSTNRSYEIALLVTYYKLFMGLENYNTQLVKM